MIRFPNARGYTVSDDDFVGAWTELVSRFGPSSAALAVMNANMPISFYTEGRQLSLEYLCRILVPNGYRNTRQVGRPFMESNAHLIAACKVISQITGREVNGALLIGDQSSFQPASPNIEALFEADCDDCLEIAVDDGLGSSTIAASSDATELNRAALVAQLVEAIHRSPLALNYRQKATGTVASGWPERLLAYYWPSPRVGFAASIAALSPLLLTASKLVAKTRWNTADEIEACNLANQIFLWGGVPQDPKTVTPANVRAVFDAAISGLIPVAAGTPLNSGWTKVAAFASEGLEGTPGRHPQVIYDSRVATSLTHRIDTILNVSGYTVVPPYLANIGTVAGRGGTRPRPLHLKWPNGYGKWVTQLAGSQLVAEIRDHLNVNSRVYGKMPWPAPNGTINRKDWTIRGVEMVLFMDGY